MLTPIKPFLSALSAAIRVAKAAPALDGRMLRKIARLGADTLRFERQAVASNTWRLYAGGVAIFAMPIRLVDLNPSA